MRGKLLAVLFGLATAGSLGFGASQAFAAPATVCDGSVDWRFPLYCPSPRSCGGECFERGYGDGGSCFNNCCTCVT